MNKLQGKDLINVGIFTAIYFVVMMAIAMLGFIPIFLPLLIVLVPLIGGIVMMLYYSKVQKFGMVSLTGLICGILMLLTGMGYWSIITGAVFGVLADLVLKSGDYKSAKKGIISHGVFSMWIIGNYIPIVATRDSYYQQLISGYGQVMETIRAAERAEAAYERKMYRYKAQYSLDCENGIENAVLLKPQTPEMVLEEKQFQEQVYAAVMKLPEKQAKRIYARYYLGMTVNEIAEVEGVDPSRVRDSIRRGLKQLVKYF